MSDETTPPAAVPPFNRRSMLLAGTAVLAAGGLTRQAAAQAPAAPAAAPADGAGKKPNIVIIWGDDIGITDVSAYSMGLMGFHTPNIDRVAKEGGDLHRLLR